MFEIDHLSTHLCTLLSILIMVPWIAFLFGPFFYLPVTSPLSTLRGFFFCFSCSLGLIDHLFRIWCFMSSIPSSSLVFLCVPPDLMQIIVFSASLGSISLEVLQINNYLLIELCNFYMLQWCSSWSSFVPIFWDIP